MFRIIACGNGKHNVVGRSAQLAHRLNGNHPVVELHIVVKSQSVDGVFPGQMPGYKRLTQISSRNQKGLIALHKKSPIGCNRICHV